jgi:hypothetical protein
MSLINEALKRTRDASAGNARALNVDSYRVSGNGNGSGIGSHSGTWVSLLVVAMATVAVLVFALRVKRSGQHIQQALNVESDSDIKIDFDKSVPRAKPQPVIVPVATPAPAEDQIVAKVVEKMKAEQPPGPAPEPTKFKLQGITSGPGYREAMINGYAVRAGEEVDGAQVVSIEARVVKLQQGDREIVLRMP